MGNWRTVDMKGHIAKEDVESIRAFLSDDGWRGGYEEVDCLRMGEGIFGLGQWVNDDGSIDVSGNLYERDFDNQDIWLALITIANKYPSLDLVLHSGSDYESVVCSATFVVREGAVAQMPPQIEEIREATPKWNVAQKILGSQ